MVKATQYVTAKYLSAKTAGEYDGKKFTIDAAFNAEIGQAGQEQDKLCIRLKGVEKPIALNQTNLTALITCFGEDTDSWINKNITLKIIPVMFNGQATKGIYLEPMS